MQNTNTSQVNTQNKDTCKQTHKAQRSMAMGQCTNTPTHTNRNRGLSPYNTRIEYGDCAEGAAQQLEIHATHPAKLWHTNQLWPHHPQWCVCLHRSPDVWPCNANSRATLPIVVHHSCMRVMSGVSPRRCAADYGVAHVSPHRVAQHVKAWHTLLKVYSRNAYP